MQYLYNVLSNDKPSETSDYGRSGIDYNYNIHETTREFDGKSETMYEFDVIRFEDKASYLVWKLEKQEQ